MKKRIFLFVFLVSMLLSCNEKNVAKKTDEQIAQDTLVLPGEKKKRVTSYNKIAISGIAKKEISQWAAFNNLEREINNILEADYRILKTELEVFDEIFKNVYESDFPKKLDVPRFKSKLVVLKTFIGKLSNEVDNNESVEVLEQTIDQIAAELNAMRNQINELYESSIDTDMLIIEPKEEANE